jgi:FkbM family methyltransferase
MNSPRTILDIGANNGDDTAYYLHCGCKVIAVDANPILCRELEDRFTAERANGRAVILNRRRRACRHSHGALLAKSGQQPVELIPA